MISVAQALSIIAQHRPVMDVETVALKEALRRRLAAPLSAKVTLPPYDASAMDGYAVKLSDIGRKDARLTVIGEAPAGKPFAGALTHGQALRLFTGSVIPKGADTIIMQENVTRQGDEIRIDVAQHEARHIRKAGIDFVEGDRLVEHGTVLSPAHIAIIAAGNISTVCVYKRPIVAILANGDELRAPGSTLKAGQIINSNPPALAAMVWEWGGEPLLLGIAADTKAAIAQKIALAKTADIIVPIGGASVGDYDHMRAAFTDAGLIMEFEKIAVKPGKPTWFGTLEAQIVLGLPGNPASAAVCAQLFLAPLLGHLNTDHSASLDGKIAANGPRETYLRARLRQNGGRLWIKPFPKQDSSLITPLTQANALIKLSPNSKAFESGDLIDYIAFGTPAL